jgi:hypothetical protein
VLERARIMKRRSDEVNTRRARSRSFLTAMLVLTIIASLTSCGGRERRAERLWRQALERVEHGDTQQAVDLLQKIIDEYPDAAIAAKAREQIVVYRGLAHAVQSYPTRRAREMMVQIARAIEASRSEKGRAPATLDELVPAKLDVLPRDPWGRSFVYDASGRGYRLVCLGADGAPGGTGDAGDLLVVDGAFAVAAP